MNTTERIEVLEKICDLFPGTDIDRAQALANWATGHHALNPERLSAAVQTYSKHSGYRTYEVHQGITLAIETYLFASDAAEEA